jgi:hypothetical protein
MEGWLEVGSGEKGERERERKVVGCVCTIHHANINMFVFRLPNLVLVLGWGCHRSTPIMPSDTLSSSNIPYKALGVIDTIRGNV